MTLLLPLRRLAFLTLALLLVVPSASAQTLHAQFVPTVNGANLEVLVQIRADAAGTQLGSSTLKFQYDDTHLSLPANPADGVDYVFHNFDDVVAPPPFYNNATVTRPFSDERVYLNIDLGFDDFGTDVTTAFMDVATITFSIDDPSAMTTLSFLPASTCSDAGQVQCQQELFQGDNTTPWAVGTFSDAGPTALPVELVTFTGQVDDAAVALVWATASETNNAGFEVERAVAEGGSAWQRIGFVEGQGTTTAAQRYRFEDTALPFEATRLRYRLKQVDFDGAFEYSAEVEVAVGTPQQFALHGAYPNPFNPQTVIRYELPLTGQVRLAVFDALGRQVRVLVEGEQAAGRHEAVFAAVALASGVYFYRLEAGAHVEIRQMMLLK